MGIILFLVIICIILGAMVFNIKMNNFKYRATQQLLKNTSISSSNIDAGIKENLEKKHLQKFLEENTTFTETSIKDLLKQYTIQIFQKKAMDDFSQEVHEKMKKDSKLDKMQSMEFKRINISYYGNSKLNAIAVYTDNKDEYDIYLMCSLLGDRIQLDKYQILKGAVVGF